MNESHKRLIALDIGEELNETDYRALRVPGGWIYYPWDFAQQALHLTGVFVPFVLSEGGGDELISPKGIATSKKAYERFHAEGGADEG